MATEVHVFLPPVLQPPPISEVYREVYPYGPGFDTLEEIGYRNYFLWDIQLGLEVFLRGVKIA